MSFRENHDPQMTHILKTFFWANVFDFHATLFIRLNFRAIFQLGVKYGTDLNRITCHSSV